MPVYNEAASIEAVIASVLRQEHPSFDLEFLFIDGISNDGTSSILHRIAEQNSQVRVVVNARRRTPFAFNIGLRQARGEYVSILGAHSKYDSDYIAVCLEELQRHGVAGCSGRVVTTAANESLHARMVAAALGSAFGTSHKSFRNHAEGYADSVNFPIYRREALVQIGGYDEGLYRNQDNDLNERLRAHGHKFYVTARTQCLYFVQPTVVALARYAAKQGYWNFITLKRNRASMRLRHLVPLLFVLSLLFALVIAGSGKLFGARFASLPLFLLLTTYSASALAAAAAIAFTRKWPAALLLPPVFFVLHASYGLATLWAAATNANSPESRGTRVSRNQPHFPTHQHGNNAVVDRPDARGMRSGS